MKNVLLVLVTMTALGGSAALALAPANAGAVNPAACNMDAGNCCEPCTDCGSCCLQ